MRKIILIFIFVGSCVSSFAQITVISETDNTTLIGSLILPSNGPVFIKKAPPVRDGFQALGDKEKNKCIIYAYFVYLLSLSEQVKI